MCLLTYFPKGSQPSIKDLEYGAEYNSDGHGFAIVDPKKGQLIVHKSMDADILITLFERLRSDFPDGPAIFHSRIGTAGNVDKSNCHPFYVGSDKQTIIAHNGILPAKAQPAKDDKRSDTRLLAEVFLPKHRFGAVHTHGGRKTLGKWAGKGNKFAILSVNPLLGGHGFLVNEEQGDWEDGPTGPIWYSNDSHDPSFWGRWATGGSYTGYGTGWADDWNRAGKWVQDDKGVYRWQESGKALPAISTVSKLTRDCEFCEEKDCWVRDHEHICGACWTCRDCYEDATECQCWKERGDSEQAYVSWWAQQETGEASD